MSVSGLSAERRSPSTCSNLFSSKTLLEETVLRLKPLAPRPSNLLILTNHEQIPGIRKALPRFPKSSLIPEPAKRDTAPCGSPGNSSCSSRPSRRSLGSPPSRCRDRKGPDFSGTASRRCPRCTQLPIFLLPWGSSPLTPPRASDIFTWAERPCRKSRAGPFCAFRRFVEKAIFGESKRPS